MADKKDFYVSDEIRNDPDIVHAAAGSGLQYASEALRNDPDIVRAAIERTGKDKGTYIFSQEGHTSLRERFPHTAGTQGHSIHDLHEGVNIPKTPVVQAIETVTGVLRDPVGAARRLLGKGAAADDGEALYTTRSAFPDGEPDTPAATSGNRPSSPPKAPR